MTSHSGLSASSSQLTGESDRSQYSGFRSSIQNLFVDAPCPSADSPDDVDLSSVDRMRSELGRRQCQGQLTNFIYDTITTTTTTTATAATAVVVVAATTNNTVAAIAAASATTTR